MKAEDLMISDWVKIIHHHTPKPLIKVKKVDLEDFRDALLQVYPEITYEPIPLTSDILEKNGFNRLDQIASIEPYYWFFFDKETEVKIKAFNTIFKGLLVECVNPVNNATTYKQCEFVHEFQHALRLCEIEKEIIV